MPVGQTTNNILEQPRKKTLEEQIASISAEAKRSATRAVQLSQLSHPDTSRKQPPEEEEAKLGTGQEQGPGLAQEQATSKTMAFGEFSQTPEAQNPNTVAAAETCQDMHLFMMNVFEDQKKISEKEVRQRLAYKWKKCLIEVVPQSPLFQESLEMQAQHRAMVEISKMRGGNPNQKEESEAKKKSFMENFVGQKHKAAYGFCCWERALEDNRSKDAMAVLSSEMIQSGLNHYGSDPNTQ
jgi:hypothetical protein